MSWRRRDVLAGLAAAGALTACGAPASTRAGAPETPEPATDKEAPMDASSRMPVLFVGHGSPMNAIEDNRWAQGFAALSEGISRPKAILAISAHWFVPGTYLTSNEQPPTIHDFWTRTGVPVIGGRIARDAGPQQSVGRGEAGPHGLGFDACGDPGGYCGV